LERVARAGRREGWSNHHERREGWAPEGGIERNKDREGLREREGVPWECSRETAPVIAIGAKKRATACKKRDAYKI